MYTMPHWNLSQQVRNLTKFSFGFVCIRQFKCFYAGCSEIWPLPLVQESFLFFLIVETVQEQQCQLQNLRLIVVNTHPTLPYNSFFLTLLIFPFLLFFPHRIPISYIQLQTLQGCRPQLVAHHYQPHVAYKNIKPCCCFSTLSNHASLQTGSQSPGNRRKSSSRGLGRKNQSGQTRLPGNIQNFGLIKDLKHDNV